MHKNPLIYAGMPAGFLYILTKNLMAYLWNYICAVLPEFSLQKLFSGKYNKNLVGGINKLRFTVLERVNNP